MQLGDNQQTLLARYDPLRPSHESSLWRSQSHGTMSIGMCTAELLIERFSKKQASHKIQTPLGHATQSYVRLQGNNL